MTEAEIVFLALLSVLLAWWVFVTFIWRPVACFVCSRPMYRLGSGRFCCDRCKREGRA